MKIPGKNFDKQNSTDCPGNEFSIEIEYSNEGITKVPLVPFTYIVDVDSSESVNMTKESGLTPAPFLSVISNKTIANGGNRPIDIRIIVKENTVISKNDLAIINEQQLRLFFMNVCRPL